MTRDTDVPEGPTPGCVDDLELLDPSASLAVAAHLGSCDRCRARLAELRRIEAALAALPLLPAADGLDARVRAHVEAAMRRPAKNLTVIRGGRAARRPPSEVVLLALGLAAALLLFAVAGGVRVTGRAQSLWTLTGAGATVIGLAATGFALRYPRATDAGRQAPLLAVVAAVPLLLFSWKVGVSGWFAGAMAAWPDRSGLRCLGLALALGGAPWVGLLAARRRSRAHRPALDGLVCGVAAGAVAWALIDLWCPVAAIPHLLLGHLAPIVLLGLAGLLAGLGIAARYDASSASRHSAASR